MQSTTSTKIDFSLSCCILHIAAYGLSLCNYPFSANLDATDNLPTLGIFSETSREVAIAIAFLLGLGDAGVNNVIYTSITKGFPEDTTSAFALMKVSILLINVNSFRSSSSSRVPLARSASSSATASIFLWRSRYFFLFCSSA